MKGTGRPISMIAATRIKPSKARKLPVETAVIIGVAH